MKLLSVDASKSYFARPRLTESLCAPGALKLANPLAWSYSVESSSGVTKSSVILKPTFADGELV